MSRRRLWLAVLVVLAVVGGVAAAATRGGGPSSSVPDDDPPGWRLVFADDFDRAELGPDWGPYQGSPGGDPYSHWEPSHVELADGVLRLRGYEEDGRWVTGGVANYTVAQTYGRWEVRFRADASDEVTYHLLLWPHDESWPPEIDFAEDFGGARESISAFVHYLTGGERHRVQRDLPEAADFTSWRTVGVEWTPEEIRFLLDGAVWATVTRDELDGALPDVPMHLALQSQAGGCQRKAEWGFGDCPIAGIPDRADVEIDWVAVYEPAP